MNERIWVCSAGANVICDEQDASFKGKGSAGWITNETTWENFLDAGPRRGMNHLYMSDQPTDLKSRLISVRTVEGYKFYDALKRLKRDLGPVS